MPKGMMVARMENCPPRLLLPISQPMQEKRRHQRIRFGQPPPISIGHGGAIGSGSIENLSLSGLMLRSDMNLEVGHGIGCEFSIFGSPLIDQPAVVVSRIGDLYGVRFEAGPINRVLLDDAIVLALARGHASVLTVHESGGRKVMRVAGGLNGTLRNDFVYSLTRVGIDEIDVSAVTAVDAAGIDLCLLAEGRYGARVGRQSECFAKRWKEALARHGVEGLGEHGA